MQNGLKIDGQMRALAIALGGAIVTSVIAMFIPASVFETITGSTGFSELVPATGAPLGDTARALIAFGFGSLAFAGLAAYLLRKPAIPAAANAPMETADYAADNDSEAPSFFDTVRAKISGLVTGRGNPDAVTDLSDLPKLRAGDAHPDAPPRRPISAHRDFGEVAGSTSDVDVSAMTVAAVDETEVAAADDIEHPRPQTALPAIDANSDTVANMVDRLESAVAERQDQIAKLEALASAEIAKPVSAVQTQAVVEPAPEPETIDEAPQQTIMEAVPSEPAKDPASDDMDAALRSALETLHRMNARTR
jgi:hypothetical protein